ncbi:MAG: hypothetical protein WBB45_06220 [Cyclobacteriaceae bacterium]
MKNIKLKLDDSKVKSHVLSPDYVKSLARGGQANTIRYCDSFRYTDPCLCM